LAFCKRHCCLFDSSPGFITGLSQKITPFKGKTDSTLIFFAVKPLNGVIFWERPVIKPGELSKRQQCLLQKANEAKGYLRCFAS
ncbi:MAG: hypothetical protein AAFY06_09970, partial [Pseudomonadota bacterium]